MQIPELHSLFTSCSEACTDTRNLIEDSMFFALKGPSFNANAFAKQALENGCKYAIIDEKEFYVDERSIIVEDVLTCLQELALYHREQLKIPVIGITGSNGKTTTKELIYTALKPKYKVFATKGNLNNHIGVPLSLLAIKEDVEIAIIEMGANHGGEIEFLCNICLPNYGVITNIGKAHLEGFGSIETIIETKTALYRHLSKNDGYTFVNKKDDLLRSLSKGQKCIFYRSVDSIDGEILHDKGPFLSFTFLDKNKPVKEVNLRLIGDYNLDNVLAAMAIGLYFKVDLSDLIQALEDYTPTNNRSQWLKTAKNEIILDAYNANPSSTLLAIRNFDKMKGEHKLAILGDMLELGDGSLEEHQKIVDELEHLQIKSIVVGPQYALCKTAPNITSIHSTEACKDFLLKQNYHNKMILIKGSRGLKMERLAEVL
jgi:UDP-N-acetylmuramoyl-tripeptide--D-alanyl-D-alanine ligase